MGCRCTIYPNYDAEAIRDHMLRLFSVLLPTLRKSSMHKSSKVGRLCGGKVFESRRLMGDHIYDMHDAVKRREFPDAVVVEREVDGHYQRKLRSKRGFSIHCYVSQTRILLYSFPQLLFQESFQLDDGCRCFSCTHVGLHDLEL